MTGPTELLECPLCDFAVLPTDDYIIQLHFEQVHTTDSPFKIEDDPEPLPPPLPKRPRSALSTTDTQVTPSSDDEENMVECPEPECGETVLLNDFNDHLDYHAAETLSFDEKTGEYRSRHRTKMHGSKSRHHRHASSSSPSFLDNNFDTDSPDAVRHHDGSGRRSKKKVQRGRSDTTSSEKSTLSRSIQTFNPFARPDRKIKPPSSSCRLGVSIVGVFT